MEVKKLSLREIGYKKLILLFLAGVILIFLSINDFNEKDNATESEITTGKVNNAHDVIYEDNNKYSASQTLISESTYYEEKLKGILQNMKGVDSADVIITLEQSSEKIVLKNTPQETEVLRETDNEGGTRNSDISRFNEETVLVSGTSGSSYPYILMEKNAKISGAIIIVKLNGAGVNILDISSAIESLFDIPAHRIKILEMK